MKQYKALLVIIVLGSTALGTASVLTSFGSLSGTVGVKPSINITGVGNISSSNETYVNITSNTNENISVSSLEILKNGTSDSITSPNQIENITGGQKVVLTSSQVDTTEVESWFGSSILHLTSGDTEIADGVDAEGGELNLNLNGNLVDSYQFGGGG